MPDVTMPRLSDSMEEATIVSWLVADGDRVTAGQELAEVETDKATVTFEAEVDGTIHLLAAVGDTVRLGAVIARVGDSASPAPTGSALSSSADANGSGALARRAPEAGGRSAVLADGSRAARRRASPLARRLAASLDVALDEIDGTGPGGRIVRADIERVAAEEVAQARPAAATLPESKPAPSELPAARPSSPDHERAGAKGSATIVELSRTQQLIARRMGESRATMPDVDFSIEIDMEAAWALRIQLTQAVGFPYCAHELV